MRFKGYCALFAVTAAFFCFPFTAVAEVGVTDTEIHIGQWGPQTGPAAPWGAVARGTDALFKMINDEGGIHGRKIVHHFFDDAYNPAKTKAGVKQLQEEVGMFAWVSGVCTACGLAVKDYLMERKIPWVGPSTGVHHWIDPPNRYLFGVYPLYTTDARALCRYGVKTMGLKRIAIAYQNDDYGKAGVEGATEELAKYGMELVASIPVAFTDTDMKPHLMKLRKSRAEAVLLFVGPGHAVRIIGTGKAMKFEPQWMSSSTCSDFPLMMAISNGLYEGVIASSFMGSVSRGGDLIEKYRKDAYGKHAAKDERWGLTYAAGMSYAEPLVEALRRCGRDLTREKFVEAMESIKDFQGIIGKISYAPLDSGDGYATRQGQKEVILIRCLANGDAEELTGWINPEID